MYDPRFSLRSFDSLGGPEKVEILQSLLETLILADVLYLQRERSTPRLYDAGVRYEAEELGDDDWRDIPAVIDHAGGDCFPEGSLLLRDDFEVIPVEQVHIGDRIWGYRDWTRVVAKEFKGLLAVDGIRLNNGDVAQLTSGHHAFVARCPRHDGKISDEYGCSCPVEERDLVRVGIRDLRQHDVLPQPLQLPFGKQRLDPDRAYVEGLYVADGWSEDYRFSISGQDGWPKEEQKHEVKAICERLGIETYWHRKHIRVKDSSWTRRMQEMGLHAPEKHFLSIDLDESAARESLRGVMADSKVNPTRGWTFTTTSQLLATQVRVLQKMFGRTSSTMFIRNHGGLGKHPIYRLGIRDPQDRRGKLLRVKSVESDIAEAICWDIETSDGFVYLPEQDVTVSNCEDLASWRVAELRQVLGEPSAAPHIESSIVVHPVEGPYTLYHIQVRRADGHIEDPSRLLGMP